MKRRAPGELRGPASLLAILSSLPPASCDADLTGRQARLSASALHMQSQSWTLRPVGSLNLILVSIKQRRRLAADGVDLPAGFGPWALRTGWAGWKPTRQTASVGEGAAELGAQGQGLCPSGKPPLCPGESGPHLLDYQGSWSSPESTDSELSSPGPNTEAAV